eukprot:gene4675-8247_t
MGNLFQTWYKYWFQFPECKILMIGLDAAGKTTILYKMALGENVTTVPTIGFNVETVTVKNVKITMWDVGGRDKIRQLTKHYYAETNVVVIVVDSNEYQRFEEAKENLKELENDELEDALVLIFANKQDLPNARSSTEITEKLGLMNIKQKWFIQNCCAHTGEGLYEGFDWICEELKKKKSVL